MPGRTSECIISADDVTLDGFLEVRRLNRAAQAAMTRAVELPIVDDATELFEEPGTLDQVETLTRDWFVRYLK